MGLADWAQVYDEGSQAYYFFNSVTGESSWEAPEGYAAAHMGPRGSAPNSPASTVGSTATSPTPSEAPTPASKLATATAVAAASPVASESAASEPAAEEQEAELAGGMGDWEQHWDEGSAAFYYLNTKTQETTWTEPEGFVNAEDRAAAAQQTQDTMAHHEVSLEDVATNWDSAYDEGSGQYYYINSATGTTSWEKPACLTAAEEATVAAAEADAARVEDEAAEAIAIEAANAFHANNSPAMSTLASRRTTRTVRLENSSNKSRVNTAGEVTIVPAQAGVYEEGFEFAMLDQQNGNGLDQQSKYDRRHTAILQKMMEESTGADGKQTDEADIVREISPEPEDLTPVTMSEMTLGNGRLKPLFDVTTLKPAMDLHDLQARLQGVFFSQFVDLHFRAESSGLDDEEMVFDEGVNRLSFHTPYASDTSSIVTVSQKKALMSFSAEPLKTSLCILNDPEQVETAVKCNRAILGYMGDRVSRKSKAELLNVLMSRALSATSDVRDEMFCQIAVQLKNNPSMRSELAGWELLLVSLACTSPSLYLAPYLMAFCYEVIDNSSGAKKKKEANHVNKSALVSDEELAMPISQASSAASKSEEAAAAQLKMAVRRRAELAIRYIIKTSKCCSQRTHPPTQAEIDALLTGDPMVVPVHFVHGNCKRVSVDSWTRICECENRIAKQLNIHKENRIIFSMHEQVRSRLRPTEWEERHLGGHERMVDVISFHETETATRHRASMGRRSSAESLGLKEEVTARFMYKARVFTDIGKLGAASADLDNAATYLLYRQAVVDVLACKYPVMRRDAIVLAALQLQEQLGDQQPLVRKLGVQKPLKAKKNVRESVAVALHEKQQQDAYLLESLGVSFAADVFAQPETKVDELDTSEDALRQYYGEVATKIFLEVPYETYLSGHYSGKMLLDDDKEFDSKRDIIKIHAKLKGMTTDDARLAYLSIIRSSKVYGAQYFLSHQQAGPEVNEVDAGKETILAITAREIIMINPKTLTYQSSVPTTQIKSWGYKEDVLMLEVELLLESNKMVLSKQYFRSPNARSMAGLLEDYHQAELQKEF